MVAGGWEFSYLEVANKYKTEWAKILQHQEKSGVRQPVRVWWKFIKADVLVLERIKGHILERFIRQYLVDQEGQRRSHSKDPDDSNAYVSMSITWSPAPWIDDQLMPFHGNEDQREDRHSDGNTLYERVQLAHCLTKNPVVHQRVDKREGETHDSNKQVWEGKVHNQDVGDISQLLLFQDDDDQGQVSRDPKNDHSSIGKS